MVKKASITVMLAVAAAIGLTACAQKTETVSTAPPPPPPMAAPPPPPEPYVAPPAPTRVVTHRRRHVRHVRHRRHTHTTTTTHEDNDGHDAEPLIDISAWCDLKGVA